MKMILKIKRLMIAKGMIRYQHHLTMYLRSLRTHLFTGASTAYEEGLEGTVQTEVSEIRNGMSLMISYIVSLICINSRKDLR